MHGDRPENMQIIEKNIVFLKKYIFRKILCYISSKCDTNLKYLTRHSPRYTAEESTESELWCCASKQEENRLLILQCVFLMHIQSVQKKRKPATSAGEGKLFCVTMEETIERIYLCTLLTPSDKLNYRSLLNVAKIIFHKKSGNFYSSAANTPHSA
jgi:hypothetical protein